MTVAEKTNSLTDNYLPIYLEALRIDSIVDFDLYLRIGEDLILYRAADLPFTDKTRATLLENHVDRLYVPATSRDRYQHYIESNITRILDDKHIPEPAKAGIVYDSTKLLIRDVLADPTLNENIRRGQKMVESQVSFIIKGREAFHNLLRVMSFDYHTYTHSVNVCTFSIAFARYLGHSDEETLNTLGTGALLHDIGKTRISDRILNKRAHLTTLEMELVRKHPIWGEELMREANVIPGDSYFPISQHHERIDGSGYPDRLKGDDIHIFGQIVGIADCFDALTTQRVYQPAVETFPALRIMFQNDHSFDRNLLEKFAFLMGPAENPRI